MVTYMTGDGRRGLINFWLVLAGAPEAVGSGIPEVMAYLNGCMISKVGRREYAVITW